MSTDIARRADLTVREQLSKTLTTGSLAALVKAKAAEVTTFLLVDCSASMNQSASGSYGGPSRMVALRNILNGLEAEGVKAPMVGLGLAFTKGDPRSVGFIDGAVPEPLGWTPLAEAIMFAQHYGAGHLIVISDGIPDSEPAALNAARAFGGPIDVFYAGEPGQRGEAFLRNLARLTNGQCQTVSLAQPKQLTDTLRKMLSA